MKDSTPARSAAPTFTLAGLQSGALRIVAVLPTIAMYGIAFGMMAASARLTFAETVLFSATVYAGAAQMATLQAWADPVPLVAVVATTLGMNARYLLLGATLQPWLRALPARQLYPTLFVLGDSNWALALKERERGLDDAAFLLGSGLAMWATWVGTTAVGHAFGAVLRDPARYGVDFLLPAFFASMLVGFARRARDLAPFAVGAAVAIACERLAPGPWSLVAGAIAGSSIALFVRGDAR
jgi:4-azaleucine resistance transporter AzlC